MAVVFVVTAHWVTHLAQNFVLLLFEGPFSGRAGLGVGVALQPPGWPLEMKDPENVLTAHRLAG